MSVRERLIWGVSAAILAVLFLMSSTDLLIKEKETQVHPISVIIDHSSDEYYGNFRKGMDKAAEEYQADVNFITLYPGTDAAAKVRQQVELVQREENDDAKAIILAPVKRADMLAALELSNPGIPVILLADPADSKHIAGSVYVDGFQVGSLLGDVAARDISDETRAPATGPPAADDIADSSAGAGATGPADYLGATAPQQGPAPDAPSGTGASPATAPTIYLFTEGLDLGGHSHVYDGVRSALSSYGIATRLVEKKDADTYRATIEETVYPGTAPDTPITIIALDVAALDETARILAGSSVFASHVRALYGAGSTTSILNQVDKGVITGLVTWSGFDAGYLSIQKAVEAIDTGRQPDQAKLDIYYVDKERLKDKDLEKILYPIE